MCSAHHSVQQTTRMHQTSPFGRSQLKASVVYNLEGSHRICQDLKERLKSTQVLLRPQSPGADVAGVSPVPVQMWPG